MPFVEPMLLCEYDMGRLGRGGGLPLDAMEAVRLDCRFLHGDTRRIDCHRRQFGSAGIRSVSRVVMKGGRKRSRGRPEACGEPYLCEDQPSRAEARRRVASAPIAKGMRQRRKSRDPCGREGLSEEDACGRRSDRIDRR